MESNEKPDARNSMLLTFINKNFTTCVIDLVNFTIESTGTEAKLTIEVPKERIPEKIEGEVILTISDDPTMMHAGDWSQMGHSRWRFSIGAIRPEVDANGYWCIIGKTVNIEQLQPEKPFDESPKRVRWW